MKKIISLMHISLDCFAAVKNGDLSCFKVDEELFDFVEKITNQADTALYGRITYGMMESYWHTAADKPQATKHDIEHSKWYKNVDKIVLSRSIKQSNLEKTTIIGSNIEENIKKIKEGTGPNILIFGSPSVIHTLVPYNLIDEFWLFLNPIILGEGIQMFDLLNKRVSLNLLESKIFKSGVVGLHYECNTDTF